MVKLEDALLSLKTPEELKIFLKDIATPAELREFEARWQIAQLLDGGDLSYRDIAKKTEASITTVTRVARFLKDEDYGGYRLVLDRFSSSTNKGGTPHLKRGKKSAA